MSLIIGKWTMHKVKKEDFLFKIKEELDFQIKLTKCKKFSSNL